MPARRKSEASKRLAGTERRDRRPPHPGARLRQLPRAPARLSASARKHWHRVGKMACAAGVLTLRDLELLALLAEALATVDSAQQHLAVGVLVKSGDVVKGNPALHVLRDARAVALRCLVEMGLTPRSRGSVDAPPAPLMPQPPATPGGKKFHFNDGLDDDDDLSDLSGYLANSPNRVGRA